VSASLGRGLLLGGLFGGGVGALLLVSLVAGFGEIAFARMLGRGKLLHPPLEPVSLSVGDFARVAEPSLIVLCGT
jgi:hypothetical protein